MSRDEQEALDAALDAALDEMDDGSDHDDDDAAAAAAAATTATTATPGPVLLPSAAAVVGRESTSEDEEQNQRSAETTTPSSFPLVVSGVEDSDNGRRNDAPFIGPPRPPEPRRNPPKDPDKHFAAMMEEMMLTEQEGVEDPEEMMLLLMEKMQKELASNFGGTGDETFPAAEQTRPNINEGKSGGSERPKFENNNDEEEPKVEKPQPKKPVVSVQPPRAAGRPSSAGDEKKNDVEDTISHLLEDLAKQAAATTTGCDDGDGGDGGGDGIPSSFDDGDVDESELMDLLMRGMQGPENGGGDLNDADADAVIDGMMEQLLCKDLMYEPMRQVATKFPQWLAERQSSLSEEEYKDREKQCQCFQRLVRVYETNPQDTKRLVALMQEVQEYGQPPAEIIKDIAPGLELDANGLPKLDGATGMPFPDDGECRLM